MGIFCRAALCWFNPDNWIFPAMIHQNVGYLWQAYGQCCHTRLDVGGFSFKTIKMRVCHFKKLLDFFFCGNTLSWCPVRQQWNNVAYKLVSFWPSLLILRIERQRGGWPGRSRQCCEVMGNIWKSCPSVTFCFGPHTQVRSHMSSAGMCLYRYLILCFFVATACTLYSHIFFHTSLFLHFHLQLLLTRLAEQTGWRVHANTNTHIIRSVPRKTDIQETSFELPLQTWARVYLFPFFLRVCSPLHLTSSPPHSVGKTSIKFLWASEVEGGGGINSIKFELSSLATMLVVSAQCKLSPAEVMQAQALIT